MTADTAALIDLVLFLVVAYVALYTPVAVTVSLTTLFNIFLAKFFVAFLTLS